MMVLVCGGRNFTDYKHFETAMREFEDEYGPISIVIHGGAKGADWLAHLWANANGKQEIEFKADWNKYGKIAGPIRNMQMLNEGKPDLVIAFPGGKGTANMVRLAKETGVVVITPRLP